MLSIYIFIIGSFLFRSLMHLNLDKYFYFDNIKEKILPTAALIYLIAIIFPVWHLAKQKNSFKNCWLRNKQ